uniref:Uncharacterized protein n=1 Tax=Pyropia fucicola TaxID=144551 RepID=A0A059XH49_9RHOD|nr:hypothetical protein [Neopyropia fucicola]
MKNKIQLKINYALVLSVTTAVYGYKSYQPTTNTLLIKDQGNMPVFSKRPTAFIPIILLKKNHQNPLTQNLEIVSYILMELEVENLSIEFSLYLDI